MPRLVGMLLAGLLFALGSSAGWYTPNALPEWASSLRLSVLAIILLRAGLTLARRDIVQAGRLSLRLATLPLLAEAVLVAAVANLWLGLAPLPALVLGFVVAPLSPAIVIPGLIDLLRDGRRARRVHTALLTAAPIDNLLAVLALGVTVDIAIGIDAPIHGILWQLPYKIGVGCLLGVGAAMPLGWLLRKASETQRTVALWLSALLITWLGQILEASFVLGVLTLGVTLRARTPEVAAAAQTGLAKLWKPAQYLLFSLVGATLDLQPVAQVGTGVVMVIAVGLLGRAMGTLLATSHSRLDGKERFACILATIPKASIQAAFASLPMDRGLAEGQTILACGIVAILLTAPLGAICVRQSGTALVEPDPESALVVPSATTPETGT